jgi:hypothetical protein
MPRDVSPYLAIGALVYIGGVALEPLEGELTVLLVPIIGLIFTAIIVAVLFQPLPAATFWPPYFSP